jgi:hypothetical protein
MKTYMISRIVHIRSYGVVCLTVLLTATALVPQAGYTMPVTPARAAALERTWQPGPYYAQIGPSCTGYALAAWIGSEPQPIATHPLGWQIYDAAIARDGIAGAHHGTTVGAGVAVLSNLGYLRAWRTTSNADTALAFLRTAGPLVIEGPFPGGSPSLDSAGNLRWAGRLYHHAWLCYGVEAGDRLACQDSLATAWNARVGGRFHMSRASLTTVLVGGQAWLLQKAQTPPTAQQQSRWAYSPEDYVALVYPGPAGAKPDWGAREAALHQLFDAGHWGEDDTVGSHANPYRVTWDSWRAEHVYYINEPNEFARKMTIDQWERGLPGPGVPHVLRVAPV